MSSARTDTGPWYREPWPWILMSGPATVMVAGIFTAWIAYATSDGLVAEDYYKQGLGVNRVLEREADAARRGIVARVELGDDRHRITVRLAGAAPAELRVRFAHATRPGHDLNLRLARTGEGRYEAAVPQAFPPGHWQVQIEESNAGAVSQWRLADEWFGREASFTMGGSPGGNPAGNPAVNPVVGTIKTAG